MLKGQMILSKTHKTVQDLMIHFISNISTWCNLYTVGTAQVENLLGDERRFCVRLSNLILANTVSWRKPMKIFENSTNTAWDI